MVYRIRSVSYTHLQPLVNMDPQREALYELCQRQGVGITVMKPFGGGDLLDEKLSPAGKALTPVQCLHYALTRPGVATVLPGAHTVEELRQSVAYETASAAERDDASALASCPKISWKGHCMYCEMCIRDRPCLNDIALGVDLNLTTGAPLSAPSDLPSLVNAQGRFFTSWESRRMDREQNRDHARIDEVRRELNADVYKRQV